MGNGGIPIPDVSGLPVSSDVTRYNLGNGEQAFSPQPSGPPVNQFGASGSPAQTPDQSIAELDASRCRVFKIQQTFPNCKAHSNFHSSKSFPSRMTRLRC